MTAWLKRGSREFWKEQKMKALRSPFRLLIGAAGSVAAMLAFSSNAGAALTPGLPTLLKPDGVDVIPGDTFPAGTTVLATLVQPFFTFFNAKGIANPLPFIGSLQTDVLREVGGTIDFKYTLFGTNTTPFLDEIHFTGFAGFNTRIAAGGTISDEEHAVRQRIPLSTGQADDVELHFHAGFSAGNSLTFYIATNGTDYTLLGGVNIISEDRNNGRGDDTDGVDDAPFDDYVSGPLLAFAPAAPLPAAFWPGVTTLAMVGLGLRARKWVNV